MRKTKKAPAPPPWVVDRYAVNRVDSLYDAAGRCHAALVPLETFLIEWVDELARRHEDELELAGFRFWIDVLTDQREALALIVSEESK